MPEMEKNQLLTEREIDQALLEAIRGARTPDLNGIRQLVLQGADINAVDKDDFSILQRAIISWKATPEFLELFLELGGRISHDDEGLLFTACFDGGSDVMAFLLKNGLNPNLLFGAQTALDFVEQLLESQQEQSESDSDRVSDRVQELLAVAKVLVDAEARHAYQLRTARLGTRLIVMGRCPTGLYTNTGCLPVDRLPDVGDEFCERFETWLHAFWELWGSSDTGEFLRSVNQFEKEQNYRKGLALAREIKRLVGPNVEVSHASHYPDAASKAGYRNEWHEIHETQSRETEKSDW